MAILKTRPRKRKKKKISSEERKKKALQAIQKRLARNSFRLLGFHRHARLADKEVKLDEGHVSDFDDIYTYENVIICLEYTVTNSSEKIAEHLRKKDVFYKHIEGNKSQFLDHIEKIDKEIKDRVTDSYHRDEILIRFVYCSRFDFSNKNKDNVASGVKFLDYAELRYFDSLASSIKHSARSEMLDFLQIPIQDIGENGQVRSDTGHSVFQATILPEANSNFPKGYRVVSFYADAKSLLERAYVLRRQGWRDSDNLYQRMLSKTKITAMRKHLKSKNGRVFVNNVIATLDADTKILDSKRNTVDPSKLTKVEHVQLQIPNQINTIGLVDGQHRTFSYYISDPDDEHIAKLRMKQNLLVTGIVYPEGMSSRARETFEARLFLEINSTQTNAKSDLTQAINRLVEPFSDESIAYSIVESLGRGSGPLGGQIVKHWYDTDKLKTASVVSYAMKPLVKTSGTDTLFRTWSEEQKDQMIITKNEALLDAYIEYCTSEINKFLIAARRVLPSGLWTPDRAVKGRLLTTTAINSLLICLRLVVENGKIGSQEFYESRFQGMSGKDFEGYHSSQYKKLALEMFDNYFA